MAAALRKDRHAALSHNELSSRSYERIIRERLASHRPPRQPQQPSELLSSSSPPDVLASCGYAQVVLQLLSALNLAAQTTDEVGFESAQCLLGAALFRGVESAPNTPTLHEWHQFLSQRALKGACHTTAKRAVDDKVTVAMESP